MLCLLQRRVMELKRASLILNTPPVTPRNSLLLSTPHSAGASGGHASSSGEKMFDLQEFLTRGFESGDVRQSITEVDESDQPLSHQQVTEFESQGSGIGSQGGLSQGLSSLGLSLSQYSDGKSATELNVGANSNSNNNNSYDSSGGTAFQAGGSVLNESVMSMEDILAEFNISCTAERASESRLTFDNSTTSLQIPVPNRPASSEDSTQTLSMQHQQQHSRSFNSGLNKLVVSTDPHMSRKSQTLSKSASTDMLSGTDVEGSKKKGKGKNRGQKGGSKKKRHRSSEALVGGSMDMSRKPPSGRQKKNKLLLEPRGPLYGDSEVEPHTLDSELMNSSHLPELTSMPHHCEVGSGDVREERSKGLSVQPFASAGDKSLSLAEFLEPQLSPGSDDKSFWQDYGQI